jgi:hypothetical protein
MMNIASDYGSQSSSIFAGLMFTTAQRGAVDTSIKEVTHHPQTAFSSAGPLGKCLGSGGRMRK